MTVQIDINVLGAKELAKYLGDMPRELNKALSVVIRRSAFLIQRFSKKRTPVDTGYLRNSIFVIKDTLGAIISTNTDYAVYVHEGTRYVRSRPFMRWGVDDASKDIEDVFSEEIEKVL